MIEDLSKSQLDNENKIFTQTKKIQAMIKDKIIDKIIGVEKDESKFGEEEIKYLLNKYKVEFDEKKGDVKAIMFYLNYFPQGGRQKNMIFALTAKSVINSSKKADEKIILT